MRIIPNQIDKDTLDIGNRLQKLRLSSGLTQDDVATRLGLHRKTISAYENNYRQPSYEVLRKLASAYNTTTDYILHMNDKVFLYLEDLPKQDQELAIEFVEMLRKKAKK